MDEKFIGRHVFIEDINAKEIPNDVHSESAIIVKHHMIQCGRCHSNTLKTLATLPDDHFYCPECINLGRMSTLGRLYYLPDERGFQAGVDYLSWEGSLSKLQLACATKVDHNFKEKRNQLLWAVTGAGKTEMLFTGIQNALKRGERVCLASPRVDVCAELYPRLKAAFKNLNISLSHGHSDQTYQRTQLTICTTHQLLRFKQAFDILIIDEVDAFPFAYNPMLWYSAQKAHKRDGSILLLTATPDKRLLRTLRRQKFDIHYLPLRYHGHLLPEIKVTIIGNLRKRLQKGSLPNHILKKINYFQTIGRRFLLFVPKIADLKPLAKIIKEKFPEMAFQTVFANDPQRIEKVTQMRNGELQFLITTTILERGVTFPKIDVIVFAADDEVFSSAALIQMAGRVGRSADRPNGEVRFYCEKMTVAVAEARKQIKLMNIRGKKLN